MSNEILKRNMAKVKTLKVARKMSKKRDRVLVDLNGPEFRHLVKGLALEAVQEACLNNMGLRMVMKNALNG